MLRQSCVRRRNRPIAFWEPPVSRLPCELIQARLESSSVIAGDDAIWVLGEPVRFGQSLQEHPLLRRFHAHYWDWAWSLMHLQSPFGAERYQHLLRIWLELHPIADDVAWHPYVVASRAWSWIHQHAHFVSGSPLEMQQIASLEIHRRVLRRSLERYLGGNHIIRDYKGLLALGVALGKTSDIEQAIAGLRKEVARQILPDGGHFERSPAYHAQVLGDLRDVRDVVSELDPASDCWVFDDAITRMTAFLSAMRSPGGDVVLFNDGFPISREYLDFLTNSEIGGESVVFGDSGFARLQKGDWTTFVDFGAPPKGAPGHSHSGVLGCWIFNRDTLVVSEAGTSTYEAGKVRSYERSTRAHSTVDVDSQSSVEVWDSFRAGRTPRTISAEIAVGSATSDVCMLKASHDGYRFLPGRPQHHRCLLVREESVEVTDSVVGLRDNSVAHVSWHLAGEIVREGRGFLVLDSGVRVGISGGKSWAIHREHKAVGFDLREERIVLRICLDAGSPEARTVFSRTDSRKKV